MSSTAERLEPAGMAALLWPDSLEGNWETWTGALFILFYMGVQLFALSRTGWPKQAITSQIPTLITSCIFSAHMVLLLMIVMRTGLNQDDLEDNELGSMRGIGSLALELMLTGSMLGRRMWTQRSAAKEHADAHIAKVHLTAVAAVLIVGTLSVMGWAHYVGLTAGWWGLHVGVWEVLKPWSFVGTLLFFVVIMDTSALVISLHRNGRLPWQTITTSTTSPTTLNSASQKVQEGRRLDPACSIALVALQGVLAICFTIGVWEPVSILTSIGSGVFALNLITYLYFYTSYPPTMPAMPAFHTTIKKLTPKITAVRPGPVELNGKRISEPMKATTKPFSTDGWGMMMKV